MSQTPSYRPVPTSGMAIASLVLGILALLSTCFPPVGILLGLIGLVLGFMARGKVKSGEAGGGGMAMGGLVCSLLAMLLSTFVLVVFGAGVMQAIKMANDPEFQKQFNDPKFKKQLEDAKKATESGDFGGIPGSNQPGAEKPLVNPAPSTTDEPAEMEEDDSEAEEDSQ